MIYIMVLLIILIWFGVFFGGKRYSKYIGEKNRIKQVKVKIEAEKQRLEEVERINRQVEKFALKQRMINENARIRKIKLEEEEKLRLQEASRRKYDNTYVRGGHGNRILASFEYGWTKGDIDDKDSQG